MEASEAGESASQSQAVSTDQQAQQNQMQQHQQYLGDVTQGLPEFDELDLKGCPLPGYCHLNMYIHAHLQSFINFCMTGLSRTLNNLEISPYISK